MRHQRLRRKLGVKTHHRKALLRNLVKHLVIRKRIQTTHAKAKEASSFADSMVELAKRGDLHARRLLIARLGCADTAHALIAQIAPRFKDRKGGYTRVLRMGNRVGDAASMALLEFTAVFEMPEKAKKPKKDKKDKEVKEEIPAEKPKKEKLRDKEESTTEEKTTKGGSASGGKKTPEKAPKTGKEAGEEKKESEKKGGFLGALRRFLKGDEEAH